MKQTNNNEYLYIICCAIMLCFSFYFFFHAMKKHKEASVLEGEKNILLKQKKVLEDSIAVYSLQADSMEKVFTDLQVSWNEDKIKFNEKLSKAKRSAYGLPADSATRHLSTLFRLERSKDGH